MDGRDIKVAEETSSSTALLDLIPVKRRETLADQIVDVLLARMTSGNLNPGDQLPTEQQLSEAFRVSRTVVREAIARLKQEGRIETQQGRGAFVVEQATPSFVQNIQLHCELLPAHIMELRRIIEPAAAALAASRRQDADLVALTKAVDALEKAGDCFHDRALADMGFHCAVAVASGNPLFVSVIQTLHQPMTDFLSLAHCNTAKVTGAFSAAEQEHAAIAKAIIDGEPREAEKAMARHLKRSATRLSIS